MPSPVARIRRRLARVRLRQVALAAVGAGSLALASVGTGWALATLAANEGARTAGMVSLGAGLLVGVSLAAWRAAPVHRFASDRAQASRLEAVRPELEGGLLTVLDRTRRPRGSAAGLARLSEVVAERVESVPPRAVWPAGPAVRDLRLGLLGLLVLLLAAWRLPMDPVDALGSIFARSVSAAAAPEVASEGPLVVLGDITLRYLYPTYTRLEPLEVPNTNGEVRAPRGTRVQVRARTAEAQASAVFRAYDLPPEPVEISEGRGVRGEFVVEGEGTWRFEFPGGSSPSYLVVPDPDLAPDVTTALPARFTVGADATLDVAFAAKDDFGLTRVVVEVNRAGKTSETVLREPVDAPRTLDDAPAVRVSDLGLAAGDRARIRVGAWDNDAVSGSKVGWSSAVEVVVEGARGSRARQRELGKQVVAALLPVLADGLLDALPAANEGAAAGRFAEQLDGRYLAFDDALAEMGDLSHRGILVRVVTDVASSRRELVAFARSLPTTTLDPRDVQRLGVLQAEAVTSVEDAVFLLDKLERVAALTELLELVERLAREAEELDGSLPKLDRMQALSRLDQLSRLYAEVQSRAAKLERGGIQTFIEERGEELEAAMNAARREIAAGDDAAAQREMARVAQLLEEMAGGVKESLRRGSKGDDQTAAAMAALERQLQALQEEQAALREATARARDEHGQSLEQGMEAWSRVDRAVAEAQRQLRDPAVGALEGKARNLDSALDDAGHDARGLADSTQARDRETAGDRARRLDQSLSRARSRVSAAQRSGSLSAAEADRAGEALAAAQAANRTAMEELHRLGESQAEASPEMSRALRELSGQQREISERAGQAAGQARALEQSLPTGESGIADAADEATGQSRRAERRMEEGDPMASEGAQRATEKALQRAADALDQARRDMQELARGGEGAGDESGGGADTEEGAEKGGKRGADGRGTREIAIPAPEEFETPEAYRKALLEGMQAEVPEAYRAAHRRYYEELVRQ